MIMQLVEKLERIKQMLKESGTTLLAAIEDVIGTMVKGIIESNEINIEFKGIKQLRYPVRG